MSVVNPNPVIKLVLDGVARRVRSSAVQNTDMYSMVCCLYSQLQSIRKLLDDDYLSTLLQHTAPCLKECSQQGCDLQDKQSMFSFFPYCQQIC